MERTRPTGSSRGACGIAGRRDEGPAEQQRHGGDRHVDQEDGAPREVLQDPPSGHRTEGDGQAGDARPRADGLGPLGRVGEDVGQDGEGGREDQRRADAHGRPGGDQLLRGLGQAGEDREHGEGDHAQLQGTLAAEAVAQAARCEQQAGEHERVGVDHPLELAGAGAQLAADRRQRHVDDGVVDDDDEQAQAQHAEDRPAAALDRGSIHGEAPCGCDRDCDRGVASLIEHRYNSVIMTPVTPPPDERAPADGAASDARAPSPARDGRRRRRTGWSRPSWPPPLAC